ncbi:spore germination protein [Bacillus sp. SCS-151]|uniref:spore germination protein n=1 Tax=Nanhaiella sioensis TaxID=3115293 RepID=UPI00397B2016
MDTKNRFQKNTKFKDIETSTSTQVDLSCSLYKNSKYIDLIFEGTSDISKKNIDLHNLKGVIYFLDVLVDDSKIEEKVIRPILSSIDHQEFDKKLTLSSINKTENMEDVINSLLDGMCVVIVDSISTAYILDISNNTSREFEESPTEQVIAGQHIGFVESLDNNLSLIRRYIKNRDLKIEYYYCGNKTKTKLSIAYIKGLTDSLILEELDRRISSIDVESLQGLGMIQRCLDDYPKSPFPQLLRTERSDHTVNHLLNGKIALFIDGHPACLILPVNFFSFFQSPESVNARWTIGAIYPFIRLLATLGVFILPSFYISVISFNFDSVTLEILLPILHSLQQIPLSPLMEASFMLMTLELLREAAVRLPPVISQTIGIVGGLIIGQAIVDAGIVSNLMVIVIALTAILAFIGPYQEMRLTIRFISFPIMVLSSLFGLIGLAIGMLFLISHLCKLKTFGRPYFSHDDLKILIRQRVL